MPLQDSQLQIEFLCCYLSELSMLDYTCVKYLPSLLSASAVFLARFIIRPKQHPWVSKLRTMTGSYTEKVLYILNPLLVMQTESNARRIHKVQSS